MNTELTAQKITTKLKKELHSLPDFHYGMIWEDPARGHKVACLDASKKTDVERLMAGDRTRLAIQDPPYNVGH